MTIVTTRGQIRTVLERWYQTYRHDIENPPKWSPLDKEAVHIGLCAMNPETATADEINRIIGNTGWIDITCTECRKDVERALEVYPNDGESAATYLCRECLARARDMMDATP